MFGQAIPDRRPWLLHQDINILHQVPLPNTLETSHSTRLGGYRPHCHSLMSSDLILFGQMASK
jgi:hypothetical protein